MFINYDQTNWYSLLLLAEFANNNFVIQATQLTLFYTNYGFHPTTIWTSNEETKNPASNAYAHWLKATYDRVMQALKTIQDNMEKYYDEHYQHQPSYEVGDEVLLNVINIRTVQPTKQLAPKLYGLFKILTKVYTHAY
jgi:hypothetical protein